MPENKKSVQDDEFDFVDPSTKAVAADNEFDFIDPSLKKKEPSDLTSTSVSGGLKSDSLTPEIPIWKDSAPGVAQQNIKLPVPPTPNNQSPFKSVAFNKEQAKIKAMEAPLERRVISGDEAYKQTKLLQTRNEVLAKLANSDAADVENITKKMQELSPSGNILNEVQALADSGNIDASKKLADQYAALDAERNKKIAKINSYAKRGKETSDEIVEISETQNGISNGWDALNAGLNSLTAMTLRAPQFVYNSVIKLNNKIGSLAGLEPVPLQKEGYLSNLAEYFDKNATEYKRVIENKHAQEQGSIMNYIDKGDYFGAFGLLTEQILESAPTTAGIALAAASGVGTAGIIGGGGAVFGAGKLEELKGKGLSEDAAYANAWANGLAEGIFEEFGTAAIVRYGKELFQQGGKAAVEEGAKNIWKNTYEKAAKKLYPVTSALGEGLSEAETSFVQNFVANVTDEDPNRKLTDGVADAFLVGAGMGAGMGVLTKKSYSAIDKSNQEQILQAQKRIEAINNDVSNPEIPEIAKEILNQEAEKEAEKISQITEMEQKAINEMPAAEFEKLDNLQIEIEQLEASLPSITDEASKSVIQDKLVLLEEQKAGILGYYAPRFQGIELSTEQSGASNIQEPVVAEEEKVDVKGVGEIAEGEKQGVVPDSNEAQKPVVAEKVEEIPDSGEAKIEAEKGQEGSLSEIIKPTRVGESVEKEGENQEASQIKNEGNRVVHAGDELVTSIDETKLQRRDKGEYGKGFYVSKTETNQPYYGKVKSYFDINNDAKILNEKSFDINDWKRNETDKDGYKYEDVLKDPENYDYEDLLKVKSFEDAVNYDKKGMNDYARKKGFDVFEATLDEIVILNKDAVKAVPNISLTNKGNNSEVENKKEISAEKPLSEQKEENKVEKEGLKEQIKNTEVGNLKERIAMADMRIANNSGKLGKNQVEELMLQPPAVRLAYAQSAYAFNKQRFKETLKGAQELVAKNKKESPVEKPLSEQKGENKVAEKGLNDVESMATDFGKVISASSRFRPAEMVVFEKPIVGKNGNKLISYQWAYEWTMQPSGKDTELKSKRVSDWTQAESSAETGRDIVHKFTVERTDGTIVTVSSETIPSLLGYVDAKEMKNLPSVVSSVKTLAKQRMQLAILKAQESEYNAIKKEVNGLPKPKIVPAEIVDLPKITQSIVSRDSTFLNKVKYWKTEGETKVIYRQEDNSNVPDNTTKEQLLGLWESAEIEKRGGKKPQGLYDLERRIERQEKKVEQATGSKLKSESLLSKESPKPSTDENKGNKEAQGRKEGELLKEPEQQEGGNEIPEPPVFKRAQDLANWSRDNIRNFSLVDEEWPIFVAQNSNDPLEIIDAYVMASEKNKSSEAADGAALLKRALEIQITPYEFSRHFRGDLKDELKSGPIAMIKRFHVRSSMGASGGRIFNDLKEELEELAKEGLPFKDESDFIDFLVLYYQNTEKVKNSFQAYKESKEMKALADAYADKGFGERLNDRRVLEYLTENAYEKLGVREKKLINQLEAKTYEEAEQWLYDRIKAGEFTLDADAPTGVIERVREDKAREEARQERTRKAQELGFDSPTHLINSVNKRLGTKFKSMEEVPQSVLDEIRDQREVEIKAREEQTEGKFKPKNMVQARSYFKNVIGMDANLADLNARLLDARAQGWSLRTGRPKEDFYNRLTLASKDPLMQDKSVRGMWTRFSDKVNALIGLNNTATSSTFIHELIGHDYLDDIIQSADHGDTQSKQDLSTIAKEFKSATGSKLTEAEIIQVLRNFNPSNYSEISSRDTTAAKVHEWFAKGAEQYFRGNIKSDNISEELKAIFEAFKQMMLSVVNSMMKSGIKLSPAMIEVYGRSFGPTLVTYSELANEVNENAETDLRDATEQEVENKKLDGILGGLKKLKGKGLGQIIGEVGAANLENAELVLANLSVAKEMEAAGKDTKTIWIATGWEKGIEGKWRYEIPDVELISKESVWDRLTAERNDIIYNKAKGKSISELKKENSPIIQKFLQLEKEFNELDKKQTKLGDIINGELLKLYPQLNDIKVVFGVDIDGDGKTKGMWSKTENTIYVLQPINELKSNSEAYSTLIHEIQHAIQDIEGFAKGGSPNDIALKEKLSLAGVETVAELNEKIKTLDKEYQKIYKEWEYKAFKKRYKGQTEESRKLLKEWQNIENKIKELKNNSYDYDKAYSKYKQLAGEVEARNAQSRMNMTPEERKVKMLSETEDVSRGQQIVLQDIINENTQSVLYDKEEDNVREAVRILSEAAVKLYMDGKSDSQNIIRDLKAVILDYIDKEDKGYFYKIIDDHANTFRKLDAPSTGMKRRATINKLLADPMIDEGTKEEIRKFRDVADKNSIRDYNPESLIKSLKDMGAIVDLMGVEEAFDKLQKGEIPPENLFPFMATVYKRMNGMIKEYERQGDKEKANALREKQVVLLRDNLSKEATKRGRALNEVKALYMLDGAGKIMFFRKIVEEKNKRGYDKAKAKLAKLKKQLDRVMAQSDEIVTQALKTEDTLGEAYEKIAKLEAELEAEKAKEKFTPRERKGAPKTTAKANPFKDKLSEAKERIKQAGKVLFDLDPNMFTDIQVVAGALLADAQMNISQFAKAMNKELGFNHSEVDYADLYRTMRDVLVEEGYDISNYQTDAEVEAEINSIQEAKEAKEAIAKIKLQLAKEDAAYWKAREKETDMRIKLQKALANNEKKIRKEIEDDISREGLWDKYLKGIVGNIAANLTSKVGGRPAEKALLDEFSTLLKNEANRVIDEISPPDKVNKVVPDFAKRLTDLANNEEKFKQVMNLAIAKFVEKNGETREVKALLRKLESIESPFSNKSLKNAIDQNLERFNLNFRDLAYKYQGLSSVIKSQVIDDLIYNADPTVKQSLADAISARYDELIAETKAKSVSEVAGSVVAATKSALGLITPKEKDFLSKMLTYLKEKATETYSEQRKAELAARGITPGKTALDHLAFAVQSIANQEGMKIWNDAKLEVNRLIDNDQSLSQIEKDKMKTFLSDYQRMVFDNVLPKTKQYQLVKQAMLNSPALTKEDASGNKTIAWKEIAQSSGNNLLAVREKVKEEVRKFIPAGSDVVLADRIVDNLMDRFEDELNRRKADIVEKQMTNAYDTVMGKIKKRKVVGRRNKAMEVVKLHNTGAFDRAATNAGELDLLANYLGISPVTTEQWNKLRDLSESISDAPTGNIANLMIEKLAAEMDKLIPGYNIRFWNAVIFGNMLLGITTSIKNATGFLSIMRRAAGYSVSDMDLNYLRIAARGYNQGDFRDILLNGGIGQGTQLDTSVDSNGMPVVRLLEYYKPTKWWNKYTGKPFQKLKYTGRILDSVDSTNQRAASEMAQYYLFKRRLKADGVSNRRQKAYEVMYGTNFDKKWRDAVDQAILDVEDMGLEGRDKWAQVKRQAWNIINENRAQGMDYDEAIRDAANDDALYAAYKKPLSRRDGPFTLIGSGFETIFRGLSDIAENKTKPGGAAQALARLGANSAKLGTFPFIRGVANLLDNSLYNIPPFTFIRGFAFLLGNEDVNTIEGRVQKDANVMKAKGMIVGNAIIWAMTYAVIMALKADHDDWEEENPNAAPFGPTGGGPKKSKSRGAKESLLPANSFSYRGRFINYEYLGEYGMMMGAVSHFISTYDEIKKNADQYRAEALMAKKKGDLEEYENLLAKAENEDSRFYEIFSTNLSNFLMDLSFLRLVDKMNWSDPSYDQRVVTNLLINTFVPFAGIGKQVIEGTRDVLYGDAAQEGARGSELLWKQLGIGAWMNNQATKDISGNNMRLMVKNPSGIGSMSQMISPIKLTEVDKWLIDVNPNYSFKKIDDIVLGERELTEKQYNKYKAKVLRASGEISAEMYQGKDYRSLNTQEEEAGVSENFLYRKDLSRMYNLIDSYYELQTKYDYLKDGEYPQWAQDRMAEIKNTMSQILMNYSPSKDFYKAQESVDLIVN
jgi:hypothetical protein